ncbi:phosphatidylinositol glycan anchor biosynthesis class O isoform X2 [Leptinotarsa decemlineata]
MNGLLKKFPNNTRLYKFVADPPTTTMQRLKALTTGSLPTFIDAGSNFATSEISEDNIIDQLIRQNHQIVFMGDDTWNGLYPNRFTRSFSYPSFNVWDLDTVDNGVREHLYPEMNNSDWSLLIGHFLGVDHCGHCYGPNHPEMQRKLSEINTVIENIVQQMSEIENTILFVIGDHGMTATGEHGGEGTDEVTSAMFVYSKEPLSNFEYTNSVKQVDLVPTLSTLLGVPIPFQNLGILVPNCLPKTSEQDNWRMILYSLWANTQQMVEYIKEYSENEGTLDQNRLNSFFQKYSILNGKIFSVDNEEKFTKFSEEAIKFLGELRHLCEEMWVQYDAFSMARGLLFSFLTVFFVFVITDGIPYETLVAIFSSSYVMCSYAMVLVAAMCGAVFYHFGLAENLSSVIFFATGGMSQVMLALIILQNWESITLNWYSKGKSDRLSNLVCRLVLVCNLCGLFSNSFIVEESFVLLFLLITVILVGSVGIASSSNQTETKRKQGVIKVFSWSKVKFLMLAVAIAALVRSSMYFWRCREEQHWCFSMHHEIGYTTKTETTKLQWTITVICLGVFVFATKEWLKNAGNLNGYSLTVTLSKFLPTAIVVCIAGFWALKRVPPNKKHSFSFKSINMMAWAVYGLTFLGIITCILKPLCAYIFPSREASQTDNSIPSILKKLKSEKKSEDVPVVYGLGTVYSSVFIIMGVYITLFIALLLGDAVAPSAVIMFMTACFILIVISILRVEKATSVEQLFEVPNIFILIWIILAQYFFYASGHQPALPNIAWEAAFVGTSEIVSNNFIPGTLIIINTFCSNVLIGFLLPLVLIAPFTIFVMIPSVCEKNTAIKHVLFKGEVILFEKNGLFMNSLFTLCCKYIVGHGIRVFVSMLAATIHCRHLMIWKIFAPKLIFESIGMLVTLGSVMLSYMILIRVNKQVERLITALNKMS